MLDDIEKSINEDMKRITSWLQQLKYVKYVWHLQLTLWFDNRH